MLVRGGLPPVREQILVADFGTELVVLVPERRRAHLLEPLWAIVFDSCRRGHQVDELVEELVAATGWDALTTRTWVKAAVDEFDVNLVVNTDV